MSFSAGSSAGWCVGAVLAGKTLYWGFGMQFGINYLPMAAWWRGPFTRYGSHDAHIHYN